MGVLGGSSGQDFLINQGNPEKKWRGTVPEGIPEGIVWSAAKAVLGERFINVACGARGRGRRSVSSC